MSVCDWASVDIESDETIAGGEKATISETDVSPCYPQANSTVLDAFPIESGYVTKGSETTDLPLNDQVDLLGALSNRQGLESTDKTVIKNPNSDSASVGPTSIGRKREYKLTERGNSYGEEQAQDHQAYINLHEEIVRLREVVQKWMTNAEQQLRDEEGEKNSTKSSQKTKNSKASRASTTSSRARALEAKPKKLN